jgi:hypothetical protein
MLEYGGQADVSALGDALRDRIPPSGALVDVAIFCGKLPRDAAPLLQVLTAALRHNPEVSLSFLNVGGFGPDFALDLLRGMKEGLKPKDRDRIEFYSLSEEQDEELRSAAKWLREKNAQAA